MQLLLFPSQAVEAARRQRAAEERLRLAEEMATACAQRAAAAEASFRHLLPLAG